EIQQMEYKLGLVQLIKAGVKLPSSALAEAWAIRDYGSFPGNTLIDQWRSEKAEEIRMGVEAELYKQTLETSGIVAAALQPPGTPQPGIPPEGRPITGMDAARLVS